MQQHFLSIMPIASGSGRVATSPLGRSAALPASRTAFRSVATSPHHDAHAAKIACENDPSGRIAASPSEIRNDGRISYFHFYRQFRAGLHM